MAFEAKELFDALADFPDGVNSGIAPLKVPRSQLAASLNATVRGTFARSRPAYRKMTLDHGGDTALQAAVESGLWQGGSYYKPDGGSESLLASLAGRLFQFTVNGATATVAERTGGNSQDTNVAMAWLWQAEKWVIWNDGLSLPVFFDGNATRRALGAIAQINTVGVSFTAPAIGSTAAVTFGSAFSGPYNTRLGIVGTDGNLYYFQAVAATGGNYQVTLKRLYENAATEASGTNLVSQPSVISISKQGYTVPSSFYTFTLQIQAPFNFTVGSYVIISGHSYQFKGTNGADTIILSSSSSIGSISIGDKIYAQGNSQPNVTVGTLASTYTVPATDGTTGVATLTAAFTGQVGDRLFINRGYYEVTAVPPATSSTTVTLLNVNAPTTVNLFQAAAKVYYGNAELPAGRMGAYGLGRVWMSLTDGRSFIASDIVGNTSSGLAAYAYRDAVLKISENGFLAGGGVFVIPGQIGDIRSMIFPAKLDTSMGQGSLLVYTPHVAFSCNTPVERAQWQDVTNPILTESMKGGGGEGQASTINANGDTHSRDKVGIRSLTLARRDYNTWGNTPISREVQPTLDAVDKSLLPFESAIEFDNRELRTTNPQQSPLGVYHNALIALNFDPTSSLRGKAPSVYDAIWTGLNVLQLVKGDFNGKERAFAFCLSNDLARIELWEILPSDGPDSATTDQGGAAIVMDIASGSINFGQNDPRKRDLLRLMDGEIYVDGISSNVTFTAYYKPDQWPNWVPWYSWTETFDANSDPGFRPRMGLGEPDPKQVDNYTGRALREAYTYQIRLVISGQCRFLGARFKAVTVPQTQFANPKP